MRVENEHDVTCSLPHLVEILAELVFCLVLHENGVKRHRKMNGWRTTHVDQGREWIDELH